MYGSDLSAKPWGWIPDVPDTDPEDVWPVRRSTWVQRVAAALLERAIADYCLDRAHPGHQDYYDARRWIFEDEEEDVLWEGVPFWVVCDVLGTSPSYIRQLVMESFGSSKPARRRSVARVNRGFAPIAEVAHRRQGDER